VAEPRIMLLGAGDLSEEVRQALDAVGADVIRLPEASDREVTRMVEDVDRVVIVSGDDAFVLRMALMVRYGAPDVPMLVTVFDETTATQLQALGDVETTSMADIVAPSLAGPCLGDDLAAVRVTGDGPVGLKANEDGDGVEEVEVEVPPRRRTRGILQSLARPYDKSARLLLIGAIGLAACLVVETVGAMIVLPQGFVDAFYGAAKTLVTVDPNDKVADGPAAFKIFISITMLLALVFEALFTAGIVNRLIDRRLTGIVGRRAVPRRDHVVVVGMGQVGLRLCLLLRRCGIGIVAVDDREDGENVGVAKELGFPVVIGRGADPSLLRGLSLSRAVALAAVTQDDLANVSIAMAARAINEDLRIVLRAGDGQLANETRSLFKLGLVRDVHRIAAALLAARATGSSAGTVICHEDEAHLLHDGGKLEAAAISAAA
jgi:Trk K+ transport system NAD-binding subunit